MIEKLIKKEFERRMLEESLMRIHTCIDFMEDKHLWYSPNDHVNSVGNMVLHLCGNIRQYIISTFTDQKDERQRSLEFSQRESHTRHELKEKIETTIHEAVEVVNQLDEKLLEKEFSVQGFKELGINIVIHVIEHTSYHTGQITTICKWLEEVDTNYYPGLDLDITS